MTTTEKTKQPQMVFANSPSIKPIEGLGESLISPEIVAIIFQKRYFLGYFLQEFHRVATCDISTLAAGITRDVTPVLYINPNFYMGWAVNQENPCKLCGSTTQCNCTGLTIEQKLAVLEHEVMHFLHKHMTRIEGRFPLIWNIAADLIVNESLQHLPDGVEFCAACGLTVQKKPKNIQLKCPQCSKELSAVNPVCEHDFNGQTFPVEAVYDCPNCGEAAMSTLNLWHRKGLKINGKPLSLPAESTTEIYYEKIKSMFPDSPQQSTIKIKGMGGSGGGSQGDDGDGGDADGEGSGNSPYKGQTQKKAGNSGQDLDVHGIWDDEGTGDAELVHEKVKEMVASTQDKTVNRQRGTIPGNYQALIDAILAHEPLSWRKILRHFVGDKEFQSFVPTRKKINRRFGPIFAGYKVKRRAHIAVIVDSSGSVGNDEFARFMVEIDVMRSVGHTITYVECDAAVQTCFELKRKLAKHGGKIERVGQGGTNFTPAIDFVLKGGGQTRKKGKVRISEKPDCLIYLTDGCGGYPNYKIPIPMMWVGVAGSREQDFKGWGWNPDKHGTLLIMKEDKK